MKGVVDVGRTLLSTAMATGGELSWLTGHAIYSLRNRREEDERKRRRGSRSLPNPLTKSSSTNAFSSSCSGGLKPSGKESGDCRNSVGQVYVRGAWYKGRYGIMYTWFAPKDETGVGGGHRYEWEGAVIWVNNPNVPDAKMVGGAVSAHHGWKTTTNIAGDVSFYQGHPLCKYYVDTAVFGTHRIGWTDKVGGLQPAVAWEQLPAPARNALLSTDWGHATFMLGYGFVDHLANAYPF